MDTLDGEALQNADQFSVKEENADQFSVKEENADQFSVKEENADWFCIKEEKLGEEASTGTSTTDSNKNRCDLCDATFTFKNNLRRHTRNVHLVEDGRQKKGGKVHKCDFCDKVYVSRDGLKRHLVCHTGVKEHKCQVCEREFGAKWDLTKHTWYVHEWSGARHACSQCGKQYKQKSDLGVHIRHVHSDESDEKLVVKGKRQCEFCDKLISYKVFDRHCQTHLSEKRFKCNLCEQSFDRRYLLDEHCKKHGAKTGLQCDICGKQFVTKGMLNQHIRLHASSCVTSKVNVSSLRQQCDSRVTPV